MESFFCLLQTITLNYFPCSSQHLSVPIPLLSVFKASNKVEQRVNLSVQCWNICQRLAFKDKLTYVHFDILTFELQGWRVWNKKIGFDEQSWTDIKAKTCQLLDLGLLFPFGPIFPEWAQGWLSALEEEFYIFWCYLFIFFLLWGVNTICEFSFEAATDITCSSGWL